MSEGVSKNSRYEIIAILREELRVKSNVSYCYENVSRESTLQKVDSSYFYIVPSPPLQAFVSQNSVFYFSIHSQIGKIEFTTTLSFSEGNLFRFFIPDMINILQRRTAPRINIGDSKKFYCSVRHKNGASFIYALNDISSGGCSFISKKSQLNLIRKDYVLDNVDIVFGEYGSVTTNLKVMSVINLPYNKFHEMDFFRISCMFQHKNAYYKDYLEGIIVKLIIDRKNTRKRFLT